MPPSKTKIENSGCRDRRFAGGSDADNDASNARAEFFSVRALFL
jgi:hypothetical protein